MKCSYIFFFFLNKSFIDVSKSESSELYMYNTNIHTKSQRETKETERKGKRGEGEQQFVAYIFDCIHYAICFITYFRKSFLNFV